MSKKSCTQSGESRKQEIIIILSTVLFQLLSVSLLHLVTIDNSMWEHHFLAYSMDAALWIVFPPQTSYWSQAIPLLPPTCSCNNNNSSNMLHIQNKFSHSYTARSNNVTCNYCICTILAATTLPAPTPHTSNKLTPQHQLAPQQQQLQHPQLL
jgi:hypothetical protein